MKFLSNLEIQRLFDAEIVGMDIQKDAYEGKSSLQIAEMDMKVRERFVQKADGTGIITLHFHSLFPLSIFSTIKKKLVVPPGAVRSVGSLESLTSKDPFIGVFLEESEELRSLGCRLMHRGPETSVRDLLIVNVGKEPALIPLDAPLAKGRLALLNV